MPFFLGDSFKNDWVVDVQYNSLQTGFFNEYLLDKNHWIMLSYQTENAHINPKATQKYSIIFR